MNANLPLAGRQCSSRMCQTPLLHSTSTAKPALLALLMGLIRTNTSTSSTPLYALVQMRLVSLALERRELLAHSQSMLEVKNANQTGHFA